MKEQIVPYLKHNYSKDPPELTYIHNTTYTSAQLYLIDVKLRSIEKLGVDFESFFFIFT